MTEPSTIAFIGGGNMASALIGGLRQAGHAAAAIHVVEPLAAQREKLAQSFGVQAVAAADDALRQAQTVVWAVKPQAFATAAQACAGRSAQALQISVMAGVRSDTLAQASGGARIVRAMPNTPALIGQGIAGLFARPEVDAAGRAQAQALFAPTGQTLWVAHEADLDAITALSGSGPAYMFYVIEAMVQAAVEMGLSAEQGRQLAQATMAGAAALSAASPLSPQELRAQVTSKGGTTHAAITAMEDHGVKAAIVRAIHAARARAQELGQG
ncbi:MAG TPA: pyrroline-5-carboxylate reductase [Rubrivivax sp.]|nr:pyrroline-5-carboxylate reductase [Rubrivivax sp.]